MFGSKWKRAYDQLNRHHVRLQSQYSQLLAQWNFLVDLINQKGGQTFLDHGRIWREPPKEKFSKAEIALLIKFCHPDKHGGDKDANEITKKLLLMR